ncbi:MAG: RNA polymerase sigma factor [Alphaproteobacteria bacterium]|nr:MAG: RNA polymerase sigma factor [Alphaproteobacteria bacterium]
MRDFETELNACLPDLWRYAMSLTRDRDEADDIVQDCLERAWRKRWLWRATQPLKPWLMKILLNTWRNHLRRRPARPVPVEAALAEALPATTSTPEERLHLAEVTRRVAELPQEQREALLLVVVGGLSYADAAAALGIPDGTLMSRLSRARARLRAAQAPAEARGNIRSVT